MMAVVDVQVRMADVHGVDVAAREGRWEVTRWAYSTLEGPRGPLGALGRSTAPLGRFWFGVDRAQLGLEIAVRSFKVPKSLV